MVLENNKANLAKYMVAEKTATQNTSVERHLKSLLPSQWYPVKEQ